MDVFEEIEEIKHQIQYIDYLELCNSAKEINDKKYMRCCENIKDIISEKKYNDLCKSFDIFFEKELGFCTCCKGNLDFLDNNTTSILNKKSIDKRCKNIEKLIKIQPFLKNLYETYEMEICHHPIFSFPNEKGKVCFIKCLLNIQEYLDDTNKRFILAISIFDFIFRNYDIFEGENFLQFKEACISKLVELLTEKKFMKGCKNFNVEPEKWLNILKN